MVDFTYTVAPVNPKSLGNNTKATFSNKLFLDDATEKSFGFAVTK